MSDCFRKFTFAAHTCMEPVNANPSSRQFSSYPKRADAALPTRNAILIKQLVNSNSTNQTLD
ncbi:hypothetical protein QFZ31_004550 [Neobacillus niacini]|uniref:hypothetical protein n=1 Tax=Neobacillus driksii TaxID=3035913 RepID=UPI00278123D2|nr:hypothetical protein [Neobacillus niacini]MDQ0974672.1 hypothetical protein [Neobacillus niacini]